MIMRVRFFLIGLFFAGMSCGKIQVGSETSPTITSPSSEVSVENTMMETPPPAYSAVTTNINSNCVGFMQAVPSLYNQTMKKYPLIVFIHGIDELGTNVNALNCCGLPYHLYHKTFPANFMVGGVNFSFLVIAPQFKERPTTAEVQLVIDFAKRRWRVDETRIYVTGLSMGCGSTWDWSSVYGQHAAAIVPVCAGTKPTTTLATTIATKNLPIWGLYSTEDAPVPEQWGRDFFSWIDAANPGFATKTKLTLWTDANHNTTWARAFNPSMKIDGYNIYEWMLLFKRSAPAANPNIVPVANAGAHQTIYLSQGINRVTLDGTASRDAGGAITRYVWSKISGSAADLFVFNTGKTNAAHLVKGTYYFRLTVTDNRGATDTDDKKVVVN